MDDKQKIEKFLNQSLDIVMSDRFGRYSKYIIQDRAIPDARDGLKPVQRRILYAMHDLNLIHNKPFKKSAKVVGDVLGKYHPHGDSSIYDAMVRMSQSWKMNIPLIEMHGNNGSVDDDPPAAMRYTEARLSKISSELLKNIAKNTVPFAPNFDDSEKEPTVFPALLPNLLVNGTKGIAAGYATEMPPHNLGEVIDAIIAKIKSPNIRLDTLLNHIKGPDFPTGGSIQGKDGIYQAFERGRGRILIRSKYEIINLKTKPAIMITEIPYGVIKSKLVRYIDEIRFNNKISGIKEVRDETDRNGMCITIELTGGTDPHLIEKYLLAKTDLQIYYNYNNVAIKNRAPETLGLIELIDAYLTHQLEIQRNSIEFDLKKSQKRLEIIQGFIKVSTITDQVIEVIKNAEGSKAGVIQSLISNFSFTELQAQAISELRLYRLSRTDQSFYTKEANDLQEKIDYLTNIISSESNLNNHLISLLRELKKTYATPRKTVVLEGQIESISINMQDLIKHEDVWVGISRDGYLKRFSNRSFESNKLESYVLKENDFLASLQFTNTSDRLLVFTNKGNYYSLPIHKIAETKFKEIGKHINDFAAIPIEEKIISAISVSDFDFRAMVVQVTKKGRVKVTPIKSFATTRFTKTYRSFKLASDDEVVGAKVSNGFNDLVIVTSNGKAVRYNTSEISVQGTGASGTRGITLRGNEVSNFALANPKDILGLVSQRGGMKRIKMLSILPMSKSTQGKTLFREIKGNPHVVVDMDIVDTKTQVLFFSSKIDSKTFKEADISNTHEGFSLIGPPQTFSARIFASNRINKENKFLNIVNNNLTDDEKFDKAEDTIKELNQISIDDLIKDLK